MKTNLRIFFIPLACLALSGCVALGIGVGARLAVPLVSPDESFAMQEQVDFATPVQNFDQLGDAAMLGQQFTVASREENRIRYVREGSTLNFVLLGQSEHLDVMMTLAPNRRRITLDVFVNGNLGTADEARVRGIVNDIVARLHALQD